MSKTTIAVAKISGVPENTVEQVLDGFRDFTAQSLLEGEAVRITDFVVIDYTDYPERERRNPKNQEIVTVPAERLPKARFSANFEKDIQKVDTVATSIAVPNGGKAVLKLPPIPAELRMQTETQPELTPEKSYYLEGGNALTLAELKKKRIKPETPVYTEEDGWKIYSEIVTK
jgi:nucleoid DNA-binding protein